MFKKVIGQDQSETSRSPQQLPEIRQAEPVPAPVQSSPAAVAPSRGTPSATRNVLSSDVEIKGSVKFTNDLVVDGKIEGEITSDGNLTVGENARIKAEIKTATVIVYGKVHGNLTATDRGELKASAEVVGDIKAKTLSIEAGAIFVGKSTVGTPASSGAAQPDSAAPVTAKPQTPAAQAPDAGKSAPPATGSQQPKQASLLPGEKP
ncbi:MAG TPA: polymer-forming cytoskeletal protein [Luteolibacter sp.]|nr:polymer-forming cytoskeletal protein [Luteolibacter sp.]